MNKSIQAPINIADTYSHWSGHKSKPRIYCLQILQTIYHSIALLNDLVGTNAPTPKRPPIIRRIKDILFTLAFCIAIYVSLTFWSIYFVDKDLIFPERIAKLYHPSFNHVMHSTVALFILIELLTSNIIFPSRIVGFSILFTFLSCYVSWFFNIYFKTGAWVYPIFEHLNWPGRILFTALSIVGAAVFYILGEKLHSIVNGKQKQSYTNGTSASKGKKKRTWAIKVYWYFICFLFFSLLY